MSTRARFPFAVLEKSMSPAARRNVESLMRGLLAWQCDLRAWPTLRGAIPEATPFVSLYAGGRLRGCMGNDEGRRAEKLARAFLSAMHDARGAMPRGAERGTLSARVSYIISPRNIPFSRALEIIEPGTHGVALLGANGQSAVLLPFVARDGALDARGLLDALARKANQPAGALNDNVGSLFVFESEDVIVGPGETPSDRTRGTPADLAADWLSRQVDRDGRVCFAVDPRTGARSQHGEAYHARASVLIAALATHGGHDRVVKRARASIAREIDHAMRDGASVTDWPKHPAQIAGALALAARAGVTSSAVLRSFASAQATEIAKSSWHAAQVVGVLGRDAPNVLWTACKTHLESHPWAPWTCIAAQAMGDSRTLQTSARALADSLRVSAPHRGGAAVTPVPEIALTAATIEALAPLTTAHARAAVRRGRAFLEHWQLRHHRIAPWMHADIALGAFPASPIRDVLRCDITGHALLALLQ